jgi:hypothetical protein
VALISGRTEVPQKLPLLVSGVLWVPDGRNILSPFKSGT